MGGLHDSRVQALVWDATLGTLELRIDDLYSNFDGLPEYPGAESGAIVLSGVDQVQIAVDATDALCIYDMTHQTGPPDVLSVTFWPSGRMAVRYAEVRFPPCRLATAD